VTGTEIIGLGHYVPERRVANAEIERRLDLQDGWIKKRTGIAARRYVADDQALSDLAFAAGVRALAAAGIERDRIDLLLLATSTPDHLLPGTAPLVAHRLGLGCGGIDMAGACGGFVYALNLADAYARSRGAAVLVIAANVLSRRIKASDRATSALFADAAGAAVVAPSARGTCGLIGAQLKTEGARYDLIHIPGGGSRRPFASLVSPDETMMVISDGQAVYAAAVDMMVQSAETALRRAGLTVNDVDYFVPHQANARMMHTIAHKLHISDGKMLSTVAEFGNSSAATIPLTLSAAAPRHGYHKGDVILMTAAGAGMTGGAIVWRW
jgi:3-oxoacyl-[acyl-carrier-protein] synthase-3